MYSASLHTAFHSVNYNSVFWSHFREMFNNTEIKFCLYCNIFSGLGTPFFSVRYVTFFSVIKKERSVLFRFCSRVFGDLWDPKEHKERNILLQRTEKNAKNATFFCKERKRTQRTEKNAKNGTFFCKEKNARTFRSFAKERENVPFFFLDITVHILYLP